MKLLSSWDDGSVYDIKLIDMVVQYDIPMTFYIPVNYQKNLVQRGIEPLPPHYIDQINNQWEIGSHGVNHLLLTRVGEGEQQNEVFESKRYWHDRGVKVKKFCYPRGYANPDIQVMVKDAGYESARSTLVGYIHESENPYFEQTTVHVGCQRKEYGGQSWLEYALNLLEKAVETPDSVYHLWGHSYEIERNNGWDDLKTLLERLHGRTPA